MEQKRAKWQERLEQLQQKKLAMLEEQRRKGELGQQQKEWQEEQDKLFK